MNVLEILQDAITTFLYGENATLELYEQQVIYFVSFAICLYLVFAFLKFLSSIFRL